MTQRRKIQMKISTCDKSDSSLSKYVSTKVNMSLILNNHSGSKQVATRVWSFEGRQRSGLREGVEEIRDQECWQRQTANDGHRREDQTNVPRGARNFIPRLPQVEDGIGDTLLAALASSSIPTLVSDWVTDDYQFETVIMVTKDIMVDMVIIIVVVMVVMVIRTDRATRTHGTNKTDRITRTRGKDKTDRV